MTPHPDPVLQPSVLAEYDAARLEAHYPHPERLQIAFRLAKDIGTCAALLNGDPVDPTRVDPNQLRWAKQRLLVRLDLHAIDLLTKEAA